MNKLNAKVKSLLLYGVKEVGSYEPEEVMTYIEDRLNSIEYETVYSFLTWMSENNHTFGHGNIDEQFAKFREWGGR